MIANITESRRHYSPNGHAPNGEVIVQEDTPYVFQNVVEMAERSVTNGSGFVTLRRNIKLSGYEKCAWYCLKIKNGLNVNDSFREKVKAGIAFLSNEVYSIEVVQAFESDTQSERSHTLTLNEKPEGVLADVISIKSDELPKDREAYVVHEETDSSSIGGFRPSAESNRALLNRLLSQPDRILLEERLVELFDPTGKRTIELIDKENQTAGAFVCQFDMEGKLPGYKWPAKVLIFDEKGGLVPFQVLPNQSVKSAVLEPNKRYDVAVRQMSEGGLKKEVLATFRLFFPKVVEKPKIEPIDKAPQLKALFDGHFFRTSEIDNSKRYTFTMKGSLDGYKVLPVVSVIEVDKERVEKTTWSSDSKLRHNPLILDHKKQYKVVIVQAQEGELQEVRTSFMYEFAVPKEVAQSKVIHSQSGYQDTGLWGSAYKKPSIENQPLNPFRNVPKYLVPGWLTRVFDWLDGA